MLPAVEMTDAFLLDGVQKFAAQGGCCVQTTLHQVDWGQEGNQRGDQPLFHGATLQWRLLLWMHLSENSAARSISPRLARAIPYRISAASRRISSSAGISSNTWESGRGSIPGVLAGGARKARANRTIVCIHCCPELGLHRQAAAPCHSIAGRLFRCDPGMMRSQAW